MSIGVLGQLTVNGDTGALGPRDRVVLAVLAAQYGEVVTADELAHALWSEHAPASANKVIQGCVVRIRKVLGSHAIETVGHGYRLAVPADSLDSARFERLVARGRELLSLREPDRAATVIEDALALWRGEALTDLNGWRPGRVVANRLEELRLEAEELWVEARLRAGRFGEVVSDAHRLAEAAPLRERRWTQLARAQYQAGRQDDALATLQRARQMLADEGVESGPNLVALEDAIVRQNLSLTTDAALTEPSATSPYLGLAPYAIDDSDLFFGRDTEVSECLRRLADHGVLVLAGPPGSGTSSLARAGVAAALRRDGARVVIVTPGARPMDALAAVPTSGQTPVLVVDECDEAVTLCRDVVEQAQFFAALAEHAEHAPLVVAMRVDRLGEMSAHPEFARLVERGLFLVGPMDEDDLRAAIEGPARHAGLTIELGLVDLLIKDVEDQPDALPLLSHVLRETWDRREGRTLTITGYLASGGIRGAAAQRADTTGQPDKPPRRRGPASRWLRVLVATLALLVLAAAAGGVVALRQAELAEADAAVARSHELAASAMSVLNDDPNLAKLLAVASATVATPTQHSIAALHRAWDADKAVGRYAWPDDEARFGFWTDLDAESQLMVASASGNYLEVVDSTTWERTWGRTVSPPGTGIGDFEITNAVLADEGERVISVHRWLRVPDVLEDDELTQSAGVHVLDAQSGELVEQFDTGPCGAVLVAFAEPYAAIRTLSGRSGEGACDWDEPDLPLELLDLRSGERELLAERSLWVRAPAWGAAFSGDGRYLAYNDWDAGEDGAVVVLDLDTGDQSVFELPSARESWGVRALSHDGSLLLYGDQPIRVWDVAAEEPVASFDEHASHSLFARFASDGASVYSTGADGVLRHWDATTGREFRSFRDVGHGPVDIVDDDVVMVADFGAGEATLVDFRARGEVGGVTTCDGTVPANALGVAGGVAAFPVHCTGRRDRTYAVSLENSEILSKAPGHQADAVAISPDGTRFVRQDGDGTEHGPLAVRDLRTGDLLVELDGLCTWDAASADEQQECRQYPRQPFALRAKLVRWSPDGSMIAAAVGAEMAVWDASSGRLLFTEEVDPGRAYAADAIFTPDSRRLIISGVPDGIRVLSTVRGRTVNYVGPLNASGQEWFPSLLGYSPDQSTLLAVTDLRSDGAAGELGWIDADTFRLVRTKSELHDERIVSAALSPRGSRIATGSSDGFVRVWDAESGQFVHEVPFNGVAVHGVAFVDEHHVAVTPADGNLLVVTTDPGELLELVRSSLRRGFRPSECERFNFGDDCPTLSELRGESAQVPR